jgi:hypothetical protein
MAKITEQTTQRLVLQQGSTTLILDKDANTATMNRKFWFWSLKPQQLPLSEISGTEVDAGVDRASGIEVCNTMLVTRGGAAWALPAADKKDAEATAAAINSFLGF